MGSTAGQIKRRWAWAAASVCLSWAPGPGVRAAIQSHSPTAALDTDNDRGPESALGRRPVAPVLMEAPTLFPTPVPLLQAVDFWTDLFLHHGSDEVVLHDKDNLQVIWQVVPLHRDADGNLSDHSASVQMRLVTDALRERLRRLGSDPTPQDAADTALLAAAETSGQKGFMHDAWLRLRSQRGVADQFRAGVLRSRLWMPQIRRILAEEGVPEEVSALPFVETMFNPQARSAVGASGLWQLMPGTARGLGLKVGRRRDERADVLRATRAAARILKANYKMLGSWPLAITAYNHGSNGLRRAVALVGSSDLSYLIANYQRSTWGFASKNFYAEFLAALHIISDLPPPSYQHAAKPAAAAQKTSATPKK
jgi:membrane-bound lytic murein transglycosylase D